MPTQLVDVVVPAEFTAYQVQNSMISTAFYQSGVLVPNAVIQTMLAAGGDSFTIPFWLDLPQAEADIVNDDPNSLSVPQKMSANKQIVRKSYLHESWSSMNFAAELAGSSPLAALQSRILTYWNRQYEKRLFATLNGIVAANKANNAGDMVMDITANAGNAANFSAEAVIDAAATLGDKLEDVKAIAMHSYIYTQALKNDLIEFIPQSKGGYITTFRGLAVTIDDALANNVNQFVTVLFGAGAIGFGVSAPLMSPGTELWRYPDRGNGGGNDVLHSRFNIAIHPIGFQWLEGAVAGESPSIAELANPLNWNRVIERKAVPLAFLLSK